MRSERWWTLLLELVVAPAAAQPVMERLTFDAAVDRAVTRHPTVEQAAAGILRAQAILQPLVSAGRFPG
jgi:hypothetical protein